MLRGPQTAAALKAWQKNEGLPETGDLDRTTKEALLLTAPVLTDYVFTAEDLASLSPVPDTWLGKSQADALRHATALEMIAERYRANPKLLVRFNPEVEWDDLLPGTRVATGGRSLGQLSRNGRSTAGRIPCRRVDSINSFA